MGSTATGVGNIPHGAGGGSRRPSDTIDHTSDHQRRVLDQLDSIERVLRVVSS